MEATTPELGPVGFWSPKSSSFSGGDSIPYAKKCACNMHVTTNYMHVMINMHVTLLLHECYMHVVRVLEMVVHVPCMLYEC